MIVIIQGTNIPILLKKPDNMDGDFHALLYAQNGKTLKAWGKDDTAESDGYIVLPLGQIETLAFRSDRALLEVKFVDGSGNIIFARKIEVLIRSRKDVTELEAGAGTGTQDTPLLDVDAVTGVIIRSYSPYIGENGHWYQYDADTKSFVDTGVEARGDKGYRGE